MGSEQPPEGRGAGERVGEPPAARILPAPPSTLADRRRRAAVFGVLSALATLLPVSRLPRVPTACALAALSGAVILSGAFFEPRMTEPLVEETDDDAGLLGTGAASSPAPLAERLSVGVGAGAVFGVVMAGANWVALTADAGIENWLRRRGVGHPRVAMAVVAGIYGAVEGHRTEASGVRVDRSEGPRPSSARGSGQ